MEGQRRLSLPHGPRQPGFCPSRLPSPRAQGVSVFWLSEIVQHCSCASDILPCFLKVLFIYSLKISSVPLWVGRERQRKDELGAYLCLPCWETTGVLTWNKDLSMSPTVIKTIEAREGIGPIPPWQGEAGNEPGFLLGVTWLVLSYVSMNNKEGLEFVIITWWPETEILTPWRVKHFPCKTILSYRDLLHHVHMLLF